MMTMMPMGLHMFPPMLGGPVSPGTQEGELVLVVRAIGLFACAR